MKSHSEQLDKLQKLRQQISNDQALLKAQQEYLESAPLELKVASAHLEQAKIERTGVDKEIVDSKLKLKTIKDSIKTYQRQSDDAQTKADAILLKKQEAVAPIEDKIAEANKKLSLVNAESGTRKRYLVEQEGIISHMMQEANESINDLHVKYSQLERSISSMEFERNTLTEDIQGLHLDKNSLENEINLIDDSNTSVIEEAESRLKEVQSKTSEELVKQSLIAEDIEKRKSELRAEIEAIDAKRAALFNENAELQTTKRRSSSARELYGL